MAVKDPLYNCLIDVLKHIHQKSCNQHAQAGKKNKTLHARYALKGLIEQGKYIACYWS